MLARPLLLVKCSVSTHGGSSAVAERAAARSRGPGHLTPARWNARKARFIHNPLYVE